MEVASFSETSVTSLTDMAPYPRRLESSRLLPVKQDIKFQTTFSWDYIAVRMVIMSLSALQTALAMVNIKLCSCDAMQFGTLSNKKQAALKFVNSSRLQLCYIRVFMAFLCLPFITVIHVGSILTKDTNMFA
jgi:hypothetical protein